jgi:DNA-binding HxlR family transcriptional regulator
MTETARLAEAGYQLTDEGRELLALCPALDAWADRWAERERRIR